MSFSELIQSFLDFLKGLFSGESSMNPSAPAPTDINSQVRDAINKGIVQPLNLAMSAVDILFAQAILETNHFRAWYFSGDQDDGKPPTFSLFNRHQGSGRGEWTGTVKYVSPSDPDLRCFTDVYQSARDMAQLLQDPLYTHALEALHKGSPSDYFRALQASGFSTQTTYADALQRTYNQIA